MIETKEDITQVFKRAGYRITRQRVAIFDYIQNLEGRHPSARQIFDALSMDCDGLSMATVYNTLGTLVRLSILKVIEFEAGENRYERNLDPHVNLICQSCGKIEDFDNKSEIHVRSALEKAGFRVSDCRLEYYGRCADCKS